MKAIRVFSVLLVIVSLFTLGTLAIEFTPSIERKDGPEVVEGDDDLIITPLKEIYDVPVDIHEDIKASLADAEKELGESEWHDIIEEFAKLWDAFTGGAPIEHAVISDIFDVRYESELGTDLTDGKPVTFSIKIQGLTADDLFMIITKAADEEGWKNIEYTIDKNGVITISATSMSTFAVIRDNGAAPVVDPNAPDSPQTGVSPYLVPAVIGAVLFIGIAAVCVGKLTKRTAA